MPVASAEASPPSPAGHHDRARQHCTVAIELGRDACATFLVGVASVGLVTALAAADQAADAPAPAPRPDGDAVPDRPLPAPGRARVLELARGTIERGLA